jgi:hypothetical protein
MRRHRIERLAGDAGGQERPIALKPGRYTVDAQASKSTKSRVVTIDGGSKSIGFGFWSAVC